MRSLLLSLVASLLMGPLPAQIVDDIRSASQDHSDAGGGGSGSGGGSFGGSSYDPDDYDDDGDVSAGCSFLGALFFDGEEDDNEEEDSYYEAPEDPFVAESAGRGGEVEAPMSVEEDWEPERSSAGWGFFGEVRLRGSGQREYFVVMPEVRFGYGPISTGFRHYTLVEPGLNYLASYRTLDWQILELLPVNTRHFMLRTGVGLMYETFGRKTFAEFGVEARPRFLDQRLGFPIEFKYVRDFSVDQTIRVEFSPSVDYRLQEWHHLDLHLSGGYLFQRYYQSVDLHTVQLGLKLVIY